MYKLIALVASALFIFILWIIYVTNTGGENVFIELVRSMPYGDKLGHFCLYGALTFMVIIGFRFRSWTLGKCKIYYGAALVTLFVVAEEISQLFIPFRTFDLIDLVADFFGILIAVGLAYWSDKFLVKVE